MADPICGDCNPARGRDGEVVQSIWLCPEHQAKQDELMNLIGDGLQIRKCRGCGHDFHHYRCHGVVAAGNGQGGDGFEACECQEAI